MPSSHAVRSTIGVGGGGRRRAAVNPPRRRSCRACARAPDAVARSPGYGERGSRLGDAAGGVRAVLATCGASPGPPRDVAPDRRTPTRGLTWTRPSCSRSGVAVRQMTTRDRRRHRTYASPPALGLARQSSSATSSSSRHGRRSLSRFALEYAANPALCPVEPSRAVTAAADARAPAPVEVPHAASDQAVHPPGEGAAPCPGHCRAWDRRRRCQRRSGTLTCCAGSIRPCCTVVEGRQAVTDPSPL